MEANPKKAPCVIPRPVVNNGSIFGAVPCPIDRRGRWRSKPVGQQLILMAGAPRPYAATDATVLWLLLAPTMQGLIDPHGGDGRGCWSSSTCFVFQSTLCSWTRARLHDDDA
jgi:hypothetical protein